MIAPTRYQARLREAPLDADPDPKNPTISGAITYDFIVPGDPLTPGWTSVPGAKRIPIEQAQSAPKIMALPLLGTTPSLCSKTWTAPSLRQAGREDCRSSITSAESA